MSVRTRVDELRESISNHLKQAIKELNEILDEDTWGNNDMNKDWLEDMVNAQANLRIIKNKIY